MPIKTVNISEKELKAKGYKSKKLAGGSLFYKQEEKVNNGYKYKAYLYDSEGNSISLYSTGSIVFKDDKQLFNYATQKLKKRGM